ncbi:sigma-70 family RNA polymerase sigma factor [Streptomyces sp. NBC_01465]|uniref:sigma-70 family RNA polymerase sigma factor n=1 Tax=Streptomyces sp. NBC_01465 TaxID=2903878 RepID=UPI002E34508E|nr:sigma-70 family RNA polymerase sigma factor [Streptomyces sp. NBC_01465]
MAGEESSAGNPGSLSEAQAERMLARMNEVIRAGEEMRKLRTEMIKVFTGFGWTQEKIARLTDMSQPAVSKQVTKYRAEDPVPPMEFSLDQHDTPWLEGRLWALAEEISETLQGAAACTRCVQDLARGRTRFTPRNVDALRRLVEDDLRQHHNRLGGAHRSAYDTISRGLDVPAKTPAATASASLRRTLAHQVQRDSLRGDS